MSSIYRDLETIQMEWGLSSAQMAALTQVSEQVFAEWMLEADRYDAAVARGEPVATVPSGMETAVPLISIYRGLVRQMPQVEDQVRWLFKENSDFGGQKPIDVAVSSLTNLMWVGYYLDSKRA